MSAKTERNTADGDGVTERYLRLGELLKLLKVSRPTLGAWRRDPRMGFPKPLRLTAKTLVWSETELRAWLALRPRG